MGAGFGDMSASPPAEGWRTPARRRLVYLLVAWIPLEVLAVGALAVRTPHAAQWLRAGLIADLLVVVVVALVLEARRAGGLGALSPANLLRAASLGVVIFAALDRLLGTSALGSALALVALCELSLVGLQVASLGRALRAVRAALARGGADRWWRATEAVEGASSLSRAVVMEACVHAAWLRALRRRPIAPADAAFGATATSSYPSLVVGIIVASALELPAVHLLLSARLGPGHAGTHLAVLALHLYSIAWLLGDRRLLAESAHTVEAGALVLRLGLRASGRVPLGAITKAHRLPPPDPFAPRKRERGLLRVTPLDPPNVRLELAEPITIRTLLGMRRQARTLELYVDEPERLCAALSDGPSS